MKMFLLKGNTNLVNVLCLSLSLAVFASADITRVEQRRWNVEYVQSSNLMPSVVTVNNAVLSVTGRCHRSRQLLCMRMSCATVFSAVTAWSHRIVAHRRRRPVAPAVIRATFIDRCCCWSSRHRQLWGWTCTSLWCSLPNIFISQDWRTSFADLHVAFLHLALLCTTWHGWYHLYFILILSFSLVTVIV